MRSQTSASLQDGHILNESVPPDPASPGPGGCPYSLGPQPDVDHDPRHMAERSCAVPLTAYILEGHPQQQIVTASAGREWMRRTHKAYAHRCLPLLIANQSGWLLLNRYAFRVTWDGRSTIDALRIDYLGESPKQRMVSSQFGSGILTFSVGYLFRTPPGFNLAVGGPTNMPKDGIYALSGVVEADWAVATFTMNWKLTRPDHPVTFETNEPYCMIVPRRRGDLESFEPRVIPIQDEPELAAQWREFERQRELMLGLRRLAYAKGGLEAADRVPYERHYFEGTSPGGVSAPEHQKKVSLGRFQTADVRRGSTEHLGVEQHGPEPG